LPVADRSQRRIGLGRPLAERTPAEDGIVGQGGRSPRARERSMTQPSPDRFGEEVGQAGIGQEQTSAAG